MSLAHVVIEEAIGSTQDLIELEGYLHLCGSDTHSVQTPNGSTVSPVVDDGSGVLYTYERWIRARFDAGFRSVSAFRFYAPQLATLPLGWTVSYGVTSVYSAPVNTASQIATNPLPSSDPGQQSPNAGGATPFDGATTQRTDWIVLQASVDTTTVEGNGPLYGYDAGANPVLIAYDFTWTER